MIFWELPYHIRSQNCLDSGTDLTYATKEIGFLCKSCIFCEKMFDCSPATLLVLLWERSFAIRKDLIDDEKKEISNNVENHSLL